MHTTFQIPRVLRTFCNDLEELQLEGATVGEVLNHLQRDYPALHRCLCDETGSVRRHIHLFVNNDFVWNRRGLDTPLTAGDVVSAFQAVSGG